MKVKLRIVQGRPQGKSMLFPRGEYVFGRGNECHVRPNSDWVSRQHCLLRVTAEGAFLRDLGSRNGTLVNGTRLLDERPLEHGDQVQVGPLVFEVVLEESLPETAPPAAPASDDSLPACPPRGEETVMSTLDTAEVKLLQGADEPTPRESPGAAPTPSTLPAANGNR
jgi:pSer/pThr/pTyr-binding forkhead associated (FHA) protein